MRTKLTTLGILALSIGFLAPSAMADPGPDGFRGKGERGERIQKLLNLSPEQADAFKALRAERRAASEPIRAELKDKRAEMHALRSADTVDRAAMVQLITEMGALRTELRIQKIDFRLGVEKLLTPEQLETFKAMKGKRGGKRFHKRGGKRFHKRGGKGFHKRGFKGDKAGTTASVLGPRLFKRLARRGLRGQVANVVIL